MSRQPAFKISGKRIPLPEVASGEAWTFTQRPGGWWIARHADGRRVRFSMTETRGHLTASFEGRLWHGEIPKESGARTAAGPGGGGDSDLTAQFPGKVRKVLVSEGAQVSEGEPLVLVEAMKMEFTIKSPSAGKILKILVKEGQQLSPGDRFLELEASHG